MAAKAVLGETRRKHNGAIDAANHFEGRYLASVTGQHEEEGWRVRRGGGQFWASALITALHDAEGRLDGFAMVTRDFSERRRQEEELRARQLELSQHLKEREVLLQEVHHRVKNNLQVISSLINMQARRMDAGPSRDALEECQTRVLAIASTPGRAGGSRPQCQGRSPVVAVIVPCRSAMISSATLNKSSRCASK